MTLACVVLAGGLGTRMRPATDRIPKALLEVRGRPFAELQLEWLAAQGVRDVLYCVGHLGAQIREHVGGGARFGLRIAYVDEGEQLRGTAGALRLAADEGALPDAYFLLYGDSYLTVDLGDVERCWRETGFPALMSVLRNRGQWDHSNAVVRDGRVVVYDKRHPERYGGDVQWIDYGLTILTRELVVERVEPSAPADLADLLHNLAADGLLGAYEASVRFYEVGSPGGLRDLEEYLGRTSPA